MQGIVNYSSSDSESEEDVDYQFLPEKKKLKQAFDTEIEASSSVVDPPTCTTSPMRKLLELGCSFAEVTHAISVCGANAFVGDIFDFIQARRFDDVGTQSSNSDTNSVNRGMEELEPSDKDSCTCEATKDKHSDLSMDDEEVGIEDEDVQNSPVERLQRMGFSADEIHKASEECNSIDFDDLLERLLNWNEDDLQSETDQSEEEDNDYDEGIAQLKGMGFSSDQIQDAIKKCGTLDIEVLLEILVGEQGYSMEESVTGKQQKSHYSAKHLKSSGPSCSRNLCGKLKSSKSCCSRIHYEKLNWNDKEMRLWNSYFGRGKEFECRQFETCRHQSDLYHVHATKRQVNLKHVGFGIPGHFVGRQKEIPSSMQGPPYFYFENVFSAPKLEWDTIKRYFNGVEPEFTDAKYFSACTRPRGYVHNLPIERREVTTPEPPQTISQAFPKSRQYWPYWDEREKINCINTVRAPDTLCQFIRQIFTRYEGLEIPGYLCEEIIFAVKKWNLIWVGPGQVAPLEPHEMEMLLGFDCDHTRGCSRMGDRYAMLGNSFQVNTVAYHLSPLKYLFPDGITVLSLFSGIGGAEVSLHKAGVSLKCVISVETNEKARRVLASWWKKSGQKGTLIFQNDVRELTTEVLLGLTNRVGKIDLVIGGSPCNNLSGNNRYSRNGLCGEKSSLFFEFPRILNIVKTMYNTF